MDCFQPYTFMRFLYILMKGSFHSLIEFMYCVFALNILFNQKVNIVNVSQLDLDF